MLAYLRTFVFYSCVECNCNVTGAVNMSCSGLGGQCLCKPGVNGRTCDACMKTHLNFSSTGCDGNIYIYSFFRTVSLLFFKVIPDRYIN